MTPADHFLVQRTFRRLLPVSDLAAALFRVRLFALDPGARRCFPEALHAQGRRHVMAFLGHLATAPDRPETPPSSFFRSLAGVEPAEHYASTGAALLWMLRKILGADFTPAVSDAWTAAYTSFATAAIASRRRERLAA